MTPFMPWQELRQDKSKRKLDPQVKDVLDSVLQLDWPAGSDQQVLPVLTKSLRAYKSFREQFAAMDKRLRERALALRAEAKQADLPERKTKELHLLYRHIRLIEHLRNYFAPSHMFMKIWMTHVQREAKYRGNNLRKLAFSTKSPLFTKLGRQWTYEYCHQSCWFDQLLEEL